MKALKRLSYLFLLMFTIFAMESAASAEWKEKVLYSFQGLPDGYQPAGGVVFDKHGNLYGATTNGGSSSCVGPFQCGTVYQVKPPAKEGDPWTETVLYVFKGSDSNDGASPFGGLIMDASGNLYGTTGYDGTGDCRLGGGNAGCGTVYELSPPTEKGGPWTETVLYNFKGGTDGQLPVGDLVFDKQGNLYGATQYGGGYGSCNPSFYQHCGTVFKLSPPKTKGSKWTEKVLHGFKGGTDGANPNGGLIFDSKGAIYGTTYSGGNQSCKYDSSVGCGTAFQLNPPANKGAAWKEAVLRRFVADQGNPSAGLTFNGNGNLFGTTLGMIFRLAPPPPKSDGWKETTLYTFNQNAYGPEGALIFNLSGDLYGTTNVGSGESLQGSVFRLKAASKKADPWIFTVIHGFLGPPDGDFPAAGLVFDKNGNLYSTTQAGGTGTGCGHGGCGTVFEVSP
jgi:hypothetical protein